MTEEKQHAGPVAIRSPAGKTRLVPGGNLCLPVSPSGCVDNRRVFPFSSVCSKPAINPLP